MALWSWLPVAGPTLYHLFRAQTLSATTCFNETTSEAQRPSYAGWMRMTAKTLLQQMVTLAGKEMHLSPPGHYRMGLVWVKLWKQTEVAGKAAQFAVVQRAACNFAAAQWVGLLSWHGITGRA